MILDFRFQISDFRLSAFYFLFSIFCSLSIFQFAFFIDNCHAATPHDEYKKIQREIKTHKERLEKAEKREHSVLNDLEKTNKQLGQVEGELTKYRKKFMDTQAEISKVEAEISNNRSNIERRKEWIRRKLRALQKYGHTGDFAILLTSGEDISQLMKTWKSLQYVTASEHNVLKHYKTNLEGLNEKEKRLTKLGAELLKNEEKIRDKEAALVEKRKDKETMLASARKEKGSYKKMIEELNNASKRLLEIIKESEKTDTYTAKGFSGLKGRLPWPVEGKIAIPYGSQKDPQFNTPVFRSGIYIQSGADSIAKAVHSGKVVFAEWFKGYGQLIIVTHGDGYHTLYGSLSEIFSKVGDIIKEGQTIGQVGNSGILNASGLYFELRYKGKPVNPLHWLKRR